MSRILLMGAPFEVPGYADRSLAECFDATGRNTGNLLIANGLVSQLRYAKLEPYRYTMSPEYIEENFDRVVVAAANFLFPGFDLSPLSAVLEKISLPAFMVGLGAQLPSSEDELKNIPEGTWRLVRIVAERSRSIGVRGYFTAEQLAKNGIKNIRVTGCPSLYTTLSPSIRIKRLNSGSDIRVVVNGSRNVVSHSVDRHAAIRVERALLKMALGGQFPYVLQNEQPEMQLAAGVEYDGRQQAVAAISKFFEVPEGDISTFYRDHGKVFFSIPEWFSWIRQFDLSMGTRFHGNMAALLNGVPAIVLVHDSRTRELCEFAAIPHVGISELGDVDPRRLYQAANFDAFEERYNALYRKYVEFLNENAIPHKLNWTVDLPPRGRIQAVPAAA